MLNRIRSLVEQVSRLEEPHMTVDEQVQLDKTFDEILVRLVTKEIIRHRVRSVALTNLQTLALRSRFWNEVHLSLTKVDNPFVQDVAQSVRSVAELLHASSTLFFKGSVVSSAYPLQYHRDQRDVDILIPSFADLWEILQRAEGVYSFKRLKIFTYAAGTLGGTVDLINDTISAQSPVLPRKLDVHIGAFPIWAGAYFQGDLWKSAEDRQWFKVPCWENCLLLCVAHVATEWYYRLRDINDLYAIVSNPSVKIDWDYVKQAAQREQLWDLTNVMLAEVKRLYPSVNLPFLPEMLFAGRWFQATSWGRSSLLVAFAWQSRFLYRRYRSQFSLTRSVIDTIYHGLNLVIYHNRAYSAQKRRIIRSIRPNRVLVLIPLDRNPPFSLRQSRELDPTIRVAWEHTPSEVFLTPWGTWTQASYEGKIDPVQKKALRQITSKE